MTGQERIIRDEPYRIVKGELKHISVGESFLDLTEANIRGITPGSGAVEVPLVVYKDNERHVVGMATVTDGVMDATLDAPYSKDDLIGFVTHHNTGSFSMEPDVVAVFRDPLAEKPFKFKD